MQLKLHTETIGCGPDLFLVHGWSLHGGVWCNLPGKFMHAYRITCVDLPGHGLSCTEKMPTTLSALAQQLMQVAPDRAVWLGWSLGASACLRAVLDCPDRIQALVLVGATPRFITCAGWPHAIPLEQLQQLASGLEQDWRKTIQKFLALQVQGDTSARFVLRRLRQLAYTRGVPSSENLLAGLTLLRDSDVRSELARIHIPALVISGESDRLAPAQAGLALASAVPGAQHVMVPGAAHAPFLSNPAVFYEALWQFLRQLPLTEGCGRAAPQPDLPAGAGYEAGTNG